MPRAAKPADRRAAPRVYPSHSARLVDVSPGGCTLETPLPVQRGEVRDLVLRLDERHIPVAARVLRRRRVDGIYRVSCAFERIFAEDRAFLEQALVREVAERMTVILR